jgi:hypothetical protein
MDRLPESVSNCQIILWSTTLLSNNLFYHIHFLMIWREDTPRCKLVSFRSELSKPFPSLLVLWSTLRIKSRRCAMGLNLSSGCWRKVCLFLFQFVHIAKLRLCVSKSQHIMLVFPNYYYLLVLFVGDHACWRCKSCHNRFSVRQLSFFSGCKLSLRQQMHLLIAFQSGSEGTLLFFFFWLIARN